jgi:hypothetical protein
MNYDFNELDLIYLKNLKSNKTNIFNIDKLLNFE